MAFFKIVKGKYHGDKSIRNVLRYILDEKKNPHSVHNVYGTSHEEIEKIVFRFIRVQELNRNTKGRRIIHFIASFENNCSYTSIQFRQIGDLITNYFQGHQIVYALHEKDNFDKIKQPHLHFAMNPVNYQTGKRIRFTKKDLRTFRKYLQDILYEEISLLE